MNKYLMLTAAALLAGASGANAALKATATIYIGGVEAMQLYYSGIVYGAQFFDCSASHWGFGQGLAAKTMVLGKNVDLSDDCFELQGLSNSAVSFDLQLPLRNGHAWTEWIEFNGTTSFVLDSGTYQLHAGPATGRNLLAETKALIEKLKKARQ